MTHPEDRRAEGPRPLSGRRAMRRLGAAIAVVLALATPAAAAADPTPAEAAAMRAALAATAAGDFARAAGLAPAGAGRDVAQWQRLRAGQGTLTDYEAFIARHADWPGMPELHRQGEDAAAGAGTPSRVLAYFAGQAPATPAGVAALVRAQMASGQGAEAAATARRAWPAMRLSAAEEATLLALQPDALAGVAEARLDAMLWAGRLAEARRMIPRVPPDWQALGIARVALQEDAKGVDALIAVVPRSLAADPGLAHDRFEWRLRKGLTQAALDLIRERSVSAAALGRPEAWADQRLRLARGLLADQRAREAYEVAAPHRLKSGARYADLEFLTGFIALRKLGEAKTALSHFQRLKAGVSTPISLSRADYWQGRANEALGRRDAARAAYGAGAVHQTAYYGLLSAERLGRALDPSLLEDRRPPDWRGAPFAGSSVLAAARLLVMAGDRTLGKRFFLHLAEGLDARGLSQLADLALAMGEPHIAVLIAKQAAGRGVILPRAYFPVTAMVPDGLGVSRALALSIARRESEFDPRVVSGAGARGLMQVMPGTAKLMAEKTAQPFAVGRLTADPAYNVRLGSAYLAQLVDEFGPAVALVAAGYNAGPGRPRRWMAAFGDPRSPGTDVVDWVETIPFDETRTYVMRVTESLVIYRARLRGTPGRIDVEGELTGR